MTRLKISTPSNRSLAVAARIRRLAVVTGTRAEWGLLEPVFRELKKSKRIEAHLIVTGMHLLPKFGRTVQIIRNAGWPIAATVRMQSGKDDASLEPLALSKGITGIARVLDKLSCDGVMVLGDRLEAFAGACAASLSRRLVVHIHGGDRATGDVDDVLRNAISRLAHLHLVASKDAASRLQRMGEQRFRIHRVGAPGLDDIRLFREQRRDSEPITRHPYAVVLQHPCGRTAKQESAVMSRIVAAVRGAGLSGVLIFPNSDPGHEGILSAIKKIRHRPDWRVFQSLSRPDYLQLLSQAAVLVGNSSSGIIESASMGIRAVNVGNRQAGRIRCGPDVIDCQETLSAITQAIRQALRASFCKPRGSIYGDGQASARMVQVLEQTFLSPKLLQKELSY